MSTPADGNCICFHVHLKVITKGIAAGYSLGFSACCKCGRFLEFSFYSKHFSWDKTSEGLFKKRLLAELTWDSKLSSRKSQAHHSNRSPNMEHFVYGAVGYKVQMFPVQVSVWLCFHQITTGKALYVSIIDADWPTLQNCSSKTENRCGTHQAALCDESQDNYQPQIRSGYLSKK